MSFSSRIGRTIATAAGRHADGAADQGFTPTQLRQLRRIVGRHSRAQVATEPVLAPRGAILDEYCPSAPSAQNAVDLFSGEWASKLPASNVVSGSAPLFEIDHVPWGVGVLGGVEGQRVLELGPLEGGHTYILDRLGSREVVAVEANSRGYLKCLIAKEVVGIPSARFLLGDAVAYMEQQLALGNGKFDLLLSSGVLYHLMDPVAALDLMTRMSDRLVLWTMYYDPDLIDSRPDLKVKFPSETRRDHRGFEHVLYRQEYQHALDHKGFCGGSAATSAWLTRDTILAALNFFGFEVVEIGHEEKNHKNNGPCICIAARRRGSAQ